MNSQEKNIIARIKTENKAIGNRLASIITIVRSTRASQVKIEAIIIDLEAKLNKK